MNNLIINNIVVGSSTKATHIVARPENDEEQSYTQNNDDLYEIPLADESGNCHDDEFYRQQLIDELIDASKEGDLTLVKKICSGKIIPNDLRGFLGWTPAHWAARYGNLNILQYFDEIGINIEVFDGKGDTVLHKAASNGKVRVVEWLLHYGFNVHSRNNNGLTPLNLANECSLNNKTKESFQCINTLLKASAATV